jgi:hypothetical protein
MSEERRAQQEEAYAEGKRRDQERPRLIKTIKAHIEKGDKAAEKSEQHYIAAGQHLKTLKDWHRGGWKDWEALLKDKIGIGKSRASELMQIADGRKTVEQVRERKAESMRQSRAVSPPRGGENADDPEENGHDVVTYLAPAPVTLVGLPPKLSEADLEAARKYVEVDHLVAAWNRTSPEGKHRFVRERWDEIVRAREDLPVVAAKPVETEARVLSIKVEKPQNVLPT